MVRGNCRGWSPVECRVIPSPSNLVKISRPQPHWLPFGKDIITPGSRWIIHLTPTLLVNPYLSTSATRYQKPTRCRMTVRLISVRIFSLAPLDLYVDRNLVDLSPSVYPVPLQST